MTRFQEIRQEFEQAVGSLSISDKTAMLEKSRVVGFFEGFTEDQIYALKTIRSDIWRTRVELSIEESQAVAA